MARSRVDAGGVALCVEQSGAGAPVVFVHGTGCDHAIWDETVAALGGGCRTIVYDRRGYGDSGAPEPYGGTTVGEQADDLAELIVALDAAPAVLCGHHLGALACLDVLSRHAELARAAVLVETPMLWLSAQGPDAVSSLRETVANAARERGAAAAVEAYLYEVGGPGTAELLGEARIDAARRAARAFAADLAATASWAGGRRELRALATPVTLVSAAGSAPIFGEVADALARLIPGSSLETVDSGHFVPVAAPEALARIVLAAARKPL